jgi:hypothetical protein
VNVAAGATSMPAKKAVRRAKSVAVATARAARRRRRLRYRYSLASIDYMFAAVAEPIEAKKAKDRRDRRMAVLALFFGLAIVSVASIGVAVLLKMFMQMFLAI